MGCMICQQETLDPAHCGRPTQPVYHCSGCEVMLGFKKKCCNQVRPYFARYNYDTRRKYNAWTFLGPVYIYEE